MIRSIREWFFQWVDKRSPKKQSIQLRQKNIYILPTRYGWLMLIILILILISSTNYQNNMGFMAGFIVLAIGLLSTFYTYRNLRGVEIRCLKSKPVFAGEVAQVNVQLVNMTQSPRVGIGVGLTKKLVEYVDVDAQGNSQASFVLKMPKRGLWDTPRMACTTIFPFGIFESWSWIRSPYQLLVYPKPIKAPSPLLSESHGSEDGLTSDKGHEDFHSLRDYQAGDPIKQVMWKAYARERGLLSKEFEGFVGEHQSLSWSSVAHYEKELAISYLTEAVLAAESTNQIYGLELPQVIIDKGQGLEHMNSCLKSLALM